MVKGKSKRVVYLDTVKFLAIWMVCIGHSYSLVTMDSPSILNRWIYSFHMPLFMLLCGYFSLNSFQKTFLVFLKQKTIQLLVPAASITLLTIFVCYLMGSPNLSIIVKSELIGGMWFLKTLFCCFVFTYIAKRIGKNDLVTAIGSIVFALLLPHGYFLQFNWMLIFFWTGFFLRSYSKAYERYRLIVTISSLLIFVLLCDHIAPQVLTYEVLFHHPLQLPRQYITGLSGSLSLIGCTYYVCKWLKEQTWLINSLAEIGTYTLGIYGLQVIVLEKLLTGRVHINNIFFMDWELDFIIAPFVGFISVLLCYALIQILKRSKPLDFLLFGNQY